jgi:hypothetical protein
MTWIRSFPSRARIVALVPMGAIGRPAGCDEALAKPVRLRELLTAVLHGR